MQINKVIGFQNFTSSALAAVVSVSTELLKDTQSGQFANAAVVSVGGSTGAIRFRDDGGAPTASVGMRLPAGTLPYLHQGDLNKLRFITEFGIADIAITYVRVSD